MSPVVCDCIVDELHRKFREKFPDKMTEMEAFLFTTLQYVELIRTPDDEIMEEQKIRDVKDRPILRAALYNGSDLLLTGDKDFLESSVSTPKIISVCEFIEKY